MKLESLKNKNKNELSMIEVAHAILSENGDVLSFADLVNKIQEYMEIPDSKIRRRLVQFYTDLNFDGSFISLGDNLWGLRGWYPYKSINEATVHPEDENEQEPEDKRRKVNAFLEDASDEDDVIDYDDSDNGDVENDETYREELKHADNDNPLNNEDHNDTQSDKRN